MYGEISESIDPTRELYHQTYSEAFDAYLSRKFAHALDTFQSALSLRPGDPASKEMIARIDAIDPDQLPADWDGSIALTAK